MNNNPCNEYVLDGSKLAVVDFEKDLGLLISKDLKWDEQVKSSLGKANQTIAWITRNVICKSKEVMKKIHTSTAETPLVVLCPTLVTCCCTRQLGHHL